MTSDQILIVQVILNLWYQTQTEFYHIQNHKEML